MIETRTSSGGGIGFGGALTVAFIVLKLLGTISWSWWWVLAPLWVGALFTVVFLIVFLIVMLVAVAVADR